MVYNGCSLLSELADLAAVQRWSVLHCDLLIAGSFYIGRIRGGSSVDLTSKQASTGRLALLYRLSQIFNSTLDLDDVTGWELPASWLTASGDGPSDPPKRWSQSAAV